MVVVVDMVGMMGRQVCAAEGMIVHLHRANGGHVDFESGFGSVMTYF